MEPIKHLRSQNRLKIELVISIVFILIYPMLLFFEFGLNIVGVILFLYVPGNAIIRVLFPEEEIDEVERAILTVATSICFLGFLFFILDLLGIPTYTITIYAEIVAITSMSYLLFFLKRNKI